MHWIALVERPDHVCCRYRLSAFRPYLEQVGHTLELRPLGRRWWSRLWEMRRLCGANVILQRRLLPTLELALLRRTVNRLIFDLDDAIFLRDSFSPRGLHHPGRMRRFAATARVSDAVVAGNSFLAEQAARSAGHDRVHVIPTCVDPVRYVPRQAPTPRDQPLELVWVGSSSTLKGLERIAPLLEEIGQKVPGLRLKLICDRFLKLRHLPVVECRWSEVEESSQIAAGDIGISWIPDDLWSRGKCGLKVLQYLAAGLPVVANPVGVHPEMISPGENGYLAQTPQQWVEALTRLRWDVELRQRMGQAGRYRLESDYSVQAGARRWLEVLSQGRAPNRDSCRRKRSVGEETARSNRCCHFSAAGLRWAEVCWETTMSTTSALLTAEAYLRMPDNGQPTELVRGEVITMPPPTPRHGEICSQAGYVLQRYLDDHPLGRIVSNNAAVITERDPDTVRGPDVAYYSYARVLKGPLPLGYLHVPPELVFEVRSPSDRWRDILRKVAEYFEAGIAVVCVLDEENLSANVFSAELNPRVVGPDQELNLPEVLADFRVLARRFFE